MSSVLDEIWRIAQDIRRLLNDDTYTICIEKPEEDALEVFVMRIHIGPTTCFHIAITGTNKDLENAKVVCSQALIYWTSDKNPPLHFAVYDRHTQKLYFCLLDPKDLTLEDVEQFEMPSQETQVAAKLQAHVASNVKALQKASTLPATHHALHKA